MVFFDFVGYELSQHTVLPVALVALPVRDQLPEVLEGLYSLLVLVDLGPLGRSSLKVNFLLIYLHHPFLERNEFQVYLSDYFVVVVFF